MSIDAEDAELLIRSTVKAFSKGLKRLIEAAEARVQDRLDLLLADLDQEREDLAKERARVDRLRESLARERSERRQSGQQRSGISKLRAGVRVIRFADEVGAKLASANDEKPVPSLSVAEFLAEQGLEERLAKPAEEAAEDFIASAPMACGPIGSLMPTRASCGAMTMPLRASCGAMTMDIGHRSYAVLPPAQPGTVLPSGDDLKNHVITVPSGWDVLSTSADDFEVAIQGLTACGWGTPLLIVQHGSGFNTYRTPLSKTGEPGSVYKENSNHLKELSVGSPRTSGGKQYRFMYSNGRLVICKSQADAAAGSISTSGSLSPGRSGSSSMSDWSPAGAELSIGRSFSDPN